jgi:DNA relaxase NicK
VDVSTSLATASLDYLTATVMGVQGPDLARELESHLGLRGQEVAPMSAYRGYTGAAGLFEGGSRVVTVQWAINRDPLVIVPGALAGKVASWLQGATSDKDYVSATARYEHQCSRKDAALDFTDECAFEVVCKVALKLAEEYGSKTSCRGDWLTPGAPEGRTLYIGSMKSPLFVRIYEHSKCHGGGDITCRVEVEYKPDKKPGKIQLAALDVAGVLGRSRLVVDLCAKFGINYESVPLAGYVRELSDLELRLVRCHMQYGRTFDELLQNVQGDLSAFTAALWAARDVLDKRKAKAALAAARPQAVPLVCL